jgi:hypothetical protein
MECPICIEPYNKRTRLAVRCPYCEYEACRSCCQTYLLGNTVPKCMNSECSKEWTLHFLRSAFTHVFINTEYKSHREEILFQQEVAMLPATQPVVEREIAKEGLQLELLEKSKEISHLHREYELLQTRLYNLTRGIPDAAVAARAEFVRNCPRDDCRGFLSTQWKCGICSYWTCPTCHEVRGLDKNEEHTCLPDHVATAELIRKDTRNCPKCATPIFKIDGCNQMWCTQCQTGFCWRTGRIETNVHNPHYFEWLRRTGGITTENAAAAMRGGECGRQPSSQLYDAIRRRLSEKRNPEEQGKHPNALIADSKFAMWISRIVHLNIVERSRFRTNRLEDNQDLRVQYLRNQLEADRFKTVIQQRNKRMLKNREITNVIDVLVNTVTEIGFRFVDYLRNSPPDECDISMLDEVEHIRQYANECFVDIAHTYGTVQYSITDGFWFETVR